MKNYITLILLTILLNGCTTHYDYFAEFIIKCKVTDSVTHNSITNAIVTFSDLGIDKQRAEQNFKKEICFSDKNGVVDCNYRYSWGVDTGLFASKPSYAYALTISKAGYESITFPYNLKENMNSTNPILINMGEVFLKPVK